MTSIFCCSLFGPKIVKPQAISKALPSLFDAKQEPVREGVKKLAVSLRAHFPGAFKLMMENAFLTYYLLTGWIAIFLPLPSDINDLLYMKEDFNSTRGQSSMTETFQMYNFELICCSSRH